MYVIFSINRRGAPPKSGLRARRPKLTPMPLAADSELTTPFHRLSSTANGTDHGPFFLPFIPASLRHPFHQYINNLLFSCFQKLSGVPQPSSCLILANEPRCLKQPSKKLKCHSPSYIFMCSPHTNPPPSSHIFLHSLHKHTTHNGRHPRHADEQSAHRKSSKHRNDRT